MKHRHRALFYIFNLSSTVPLYRQTSTSYALSTINKGIKKLIIKSSMKLSHLAFRVPVTVTIEHGDCAWMVGCLVHWPTKHTYEVQTSVWKPVIKGFGSIYVRRSRLFRFIKIKSFESTSSFYCKCAPFQHHSSGKLYCYISTICLQRIHSLAFINFHNNFLIQNKIY